MSMMEDHPAERAIPRPMASEFASQRALFGTSALLFVIGAAITVVWSASMSSMDGMPMAGGWSMSMTWMRMRYCSLGLTAVLLAVGIIDLRMMTVVTVAITGERLAPDGERIARAIGAVVVVVGLGLIMHAGLQG
ncbi:putative metal-binding integral membrane protein DUF2182 [Trinickia symbiotica]|nr:putative metal-binding integral membrane protein DUF2182 [Trinickia symbiotica]